jgi:hypothetical protein
MLTYRQQQQREMRKEITSLHISQVNASMKYNATGQLIYKALSDKLARMKEDAEKQLDAEMAREW